MGALSASDFNEQVKNGLASLDQALIWHLRSNHYPPIPLSMLEPCKQAIEAGNAGEWDKQIELPAGVSWRGQNTAPAGQIIEAHHLDSFLDSDDND